MPVVLALISSVLWGTSDFFGGTASKTTPSTTVLLWASLIALPVMTVIAVVSDDLVFDSTVVGWGIVAGVACSIGIVLLYRGLATGPMGVVAPIASTSVLVPVVAGFVRGESPGAIQTVGIAIAVIGVILAGGPHLRDFRTGGHRPILLALGAALGIGISLLAVANGSDHSAYSTLLVMRVVYPVLLFAIVLATRAPRRPATSVVPMVAIAGIGDVVAVTLYGVATTSGSLPVVAALASMFPVMTLVLARQVHHERLDREQWIGAALALIGVIVVVTT
jgi:drug/metabolite transporter (DMT)-like permease